MVKSQQVTQDNEDVTAWGPGMVLKELEFLLRKAHREVPLSLYAPFHWV
jgi:hypothetical protein